MAYIPGMRGAAMDRNRMYVHQEPGNINTVRTALNDRERFELDQVANMHNQQLQQQLGNQRKINTGNKPDFDAFLKLLTEQLKHQDPLKPMEDKDFIAQMAQFSSLGEMVKFNKSMSQLLQDNQKSSQFNLLGKRVYYYHTTGDNRETRSGKVNAVAINDGNYEVIVDNQSIPINRIFRVETEPEAPTNAPVNRQQTQVQNNSSSRNDREEIQPSTIGIRAEFHNRINAALNQHVINQGQ